MVVVVMGCCGSGGDMVSTTGGVAALVGRYTEEFTLCWVGMEEKEEENDASSCTSCMAGVKVELCSRA